MEYEHLYQEYFAPIRKYLAAYVGDAYADELTQEVFLKVSNNLDTFRGESSIKTWIYRIASNQAKDFLKCKQQKIRDAILKKDLEQVELDSHTNTTPEHINITEQMNSCIKEFIQRLPYEYSATLLLADLEGHNMKDIAEILGISENAVKVRLHRARAKLKDEMARGCTISATADSRIQCDRK